MVAFGGALILLGKLYLSNGILVYENAKSQPLWSVGVIACGVFIVLLALLPVSWVESLVRRNERKHPFR